MLQLSHVTASQARTNLYQLLKTTGQGLRAYEISLRGNDPVVLINKSELESWWESIDVMQNRDELAALKKAQKETSAITHQQLLKTLKLKNGSQL